MVKIGSASAVAFAVTGARPPIGSRNGPGDLDPYDPAAALIFNTAAGDCWANALTRFFEDELDQLDWLSDYMMDTEVFDSEQDHGPSFAVEAEPEEEYEKKALTTIESDSGWDIT